MRNIMLYEQYKELYANYLILKPVSKNRDYTYKAGDLVVTISTGEGNHRKTTTGN